MIEKNEVKKTPVVLFPGTYSEIDKINDRITFGMELLKEFALDNNAEVKKRGQKLSKNEYRNLVAKMLNCFVLAQLGSLELLAEELNDIPVDNIYTEQRKSKYVKNINKFLNPLLP